MNYGKLLDVFRDGFRSYDDYCACPYSRDMIEFDYWWEGFKFAEEMCDAILLEIKK